MLVSATQIHAIGHQEAIIMRVKKDSTTVESVPIEEILKTLTSTDAEVSSLTLGGRFLLARLSSRDKLALLDVLVGAIKKNPKLVSLYLTNLPAVTEEEQMFNSIFFSKVLALLNHTSVTNLSVDFLGIGILLNHLENLTKLRSLKVVCKADELSSFVENWNHLTWPPHLSELSLKISNHIQHRQPNTSDNTITDELLKLVKKILQLRGMDTENTSKLRKLTLDLDKNFILDLAFFEKLGRVFANLKINGIEHDLEEIHITCKVAENAVAKAVRILDANPKLQIHFPQGKNQYTLLYGVMEVFNLRNYFNRNPAEARVDSTASATDSPLCMSARSPSSCTDEEKKPNCDIGSQKRSVSRTESAVESPGFTYGSCRLNFYSPVTPRAENSAKKPKMQSSPAVLEQLSSSSQFTFSSPVKRSVKKAEVEGSPASDESFSLN